MSTKFYIKDENGIFLSTDGKIRYTMLKGKELYNFSKARMGNIGVSMLTSMTMATRLDSK